MCQHCNSDYSLWGLRDAALFSCLWDGLLRCSEACGLDVADFRDTDDPDDLHVRLLRSLCRSCSYGRIRGAAVLLGEIGGGREPPFLPPGSARRCGATYICAAPPRGALLSQVSLAGRPGPWAWPTNDNADALERDSMKRRHAVLVLADAGAVIWRTRYDPRGGLGTHPALRGPIVRLASSLPCIIPPS